MAAKLTTILNDVMLLLLRYNLECKVISLTYPSPRMLHKYNCSVLSFLNSLSKLTTRQMILKGVPLGVADLPLKFCSEKPNTTNNFCNRNVNSSTGHFFYSTHTHRQLKFVVVSLVFVPELRPCCIPASARSFL